MPVIKSAKKKLRQDKKRQVQNKSIKTLLKSLIKKMQVSPSKETVSAVAKIADIAAKKHIIHKNKAARIKSSADISIGANAKPPTVKAKASAKKAALKKLKAKTLKKAKK